MKCPQWNKFSAKWKLHIPPKGSAKRKQYDIEAEIALTALREATQ